MSAIIAVPKYYIDRILNNETSFLFWDNLPNELKFYSGINSYIFNDDNSTIYMCNGNKILVSANIAAIYNLQFKRKNSVGLKIINARTACLEAVYAEWTHKDSENKTKDSEEFYEYLNKIGFHSNYCIMLKNVKPYKDV